MQEAEEAVTSAENNLNTITSDGADKIEEYGQALDSLRAAERTKETEKTSAESTLQAARDSDSGVSAAEAMFAAATTSAEEATAAVENMENEKSTYESELATSKTGAQTQIDSAQTAVSAAQAFLATKTQLRTDAEATAAGAAEEYVGLQSHATDAQSEMEQAEAALRDVAATKASLLEQTDDLSKKVKSAGESASLLEHEAAEAKHDRSVAVDEEESQLGTLSAQTAEAKAVKWDEQFDLLKKKVSTVTDMYNKFVSCVQDSKWEC